jgi:acetyl-CoA carboxylase carboxyl transferase subunit beta
VGQTTPAAELASSSRPAAVPEEQRWVKCPKDGAFIYHKRLERNLKVCPECNYHFRLSARERLAYLIDADSFQELSGDIEPSDPLGFVDSKPYPARIKEAQRKTGQKEGTIYGTATLDGMALVVAIMDFGFIGGAMGSAVGEAITRAAELAAERRLPLLLICASGGARMQEGCLSLMQMAKTSAALAVLAERGLPCLVLLTDPTYGGVTASFATLGDLLITEPDAMIGFAGRSIVESTIKQKLPPDFQRSDFLLEHGMVDMIVPRGELRGTLSRLLSCYQGAVAGKRPSPEQLPPDEASPQRANEAPREAWDIVQLARQPERPNALEYVTGIFSDFQKLHGDRLFREDGALLGGLARLGDVTCVVLGTLKGRSLKENVERNFGMPHPEGYRKALRLMQHAARFHMPIIAFIDTPGAYPGIGAEERGQSVAIARNLFEMARLPVPIIAALTGEGGSGGALALAVADRVLMLENAYYSVISPEGCSVILFKNVTAAPQAAQALRLTAPDLKRLGVIDEIVSEPAGGAHTDREATTRALRTSLLRHLRELLPKGPDQLRAERYARYRAFGAPAH